MEQIFPIEIPDDVADAHRRLHDFFVHNGYTTDDDSARPLIMTRGTRGASWWSSNMTELQTRVTLVAEPPAKLTYQVEATGQILSDEDRAFWKREARAAEAYLLGRGELVDLRRQEAQRSRKVAGEHRKLALQATLLVFLTVFVLGVLADRLGLWQWY